MRKKEITTEKYKIIITKNGSRKEIGLSDDELTVGTYKSDSVRYPKKLFDEDFELRVWYSEKKWIISCKTGNIYLQEGIIKQKSIVLSETVTVEVRFEKNGEMLFELGFMPDYDAEYREMTHLFSIPEDSSILIGYGENCDIKIKGSLNDRGTVSLHGDTSGKLTVKDNKTKFGVYVNGNIIKNSFTVSDFDFFSAFGSDFYYKEGKVWCFGEDKVFSEKLNAQRILETESVLKYPKLNRTTRLRPVKSFDKIELLDPPEKIQRQKRNPVAALLPSAAALFLTVFLRTKIMKGGSGYILLSACMMGMGIMTTAAGLIAEPFEYRKKCRLREEKYSKYLTDKENAVKKARDEELTVLNEIHSSVTKDIQNVECFNEHIFEKSPGEDDFLDIYLGTGKYLSDREICIRKSEKLEAGDDLKKKQEELLEKYKYIEDAPIVLHACGKITGVVGNCEKRKAMFLEMITDAACRHHYSELKIYCMAGPENASLMYNVRMLPHIQDSIINGDEKKEVRFRNLICDEKSREFVLDGLYRELADRENGSANSPHILLFVFDDMGLRSHPVSKYLSNGSKTGVTCIFFDEHKEFLPEKCSYLITLEDESNSGTLMDVSENRNIQFEYNAPDEKTVEKICTRLAPVYCDEVTLNSNLTKNISLFSLLDIFSCDELDLMKKWHTGDTSGSLSVPVGVRSDGETVALDIHEKAHGPHGLIAGTTGSGKSELLQTFILSAAVHYHPYELGFIIIDFKGGGLADQFSSLPHVLGTITNLDGDETERSLQSIKAELIRRQNLFHEAKVNHIDKFISLYRQGKVSEPLPHLVIVADEFAELKEEHPEFMKELISAARIGRSLGIHLILATQKPHGQVNDQIWSNSRFRICLKVQNAEDSKEVIKSSLASEITEPGRAYFQVGNNEIFELFQSAYTGESADIHEEKAASDITVSAVSLSGERKILCSANTAKQKKGRTQSEELTEYIGRICSENKIERLRPICCPALEDSISFRSVPSEGRHITVCTGVYDDPENQYQGDMIMDLSTSNIFAAGMTQFGKTNLLECIIHAAGEEYSPADVNIYILDFASGILKAYENLCHVGGVILPDEEEKLRSFFRMISLEMKKRKEKLSSLNISSFASYRDAGFSDIPQIVVMLDGYSFFKELYFEKYEQEWLSICQNGISMGISVVMTCRQPGGISSRYLNCFADRIAFYCNDRSEYAPMFERCNYTIKEKPGRALVKCGRSVYLMQVFNSFGCEDGSEKSAVIKCFITETDKKYPELRAKQVPFVPDMITNKYISENFEGSNNPYEISPALDYETVDAVRFDISKISELTLLGGEKEKKRKFLRCFLDCIEEKSDKIRINAFIIDDFNRTFSDCRDRYSFVKGYSSGLDDMENILASLEEKTAERYDVLMKSGYEGLSEEPVYLVIINNSSYLKKFTAGSALMKRYSKISEYGSELKILFVFADADDVSSVGSPEIMKHIKETRKAVVFSEIRSFKLFDVTGQQLRMNSKNLDDTSAYYINENEFSRIRFAECMEN